VLVGEVFFGASFGGIWARGLAVFPTGDGGRNGRATKAACERSRGSKFFRQLLRIFRFSIRTISNVLQKQDRSCGKFGKKYVVKCPEFGNCPFEVNTLAIDVGGKQGVLLQGWGAQLLFFIFITLEPRIEWYNNL